MNKKQYKYLWTGVQIFLFLIPMICAIVFTPYEISREKHYVTTINRRALIEGYKTEQTFTDFTEAVVAKNDALEVYEKGTWKTKHPELYWYESIIGALLLGIIFQVFNFIWVSIYNDLYVSKDEDDNRDSHYGL